MLRRHIVLLIAIRPWDGDVKPSGPLGAFREEQAMSRHRVSTFSLPFIIIPHSTTQTATHTVTLKPQLPTVHYTDTRPTRNVV